MDHMDHINPTARRQLTGRRWTPSALLLTLGVVLVLPTLGVSGSAAAEPPAGVARIAVASVAAPAGPVRAVSAGGMGSCEVGTDGVAYCWGSNEWGQLGDGSTTQRTVPTKVLRADWAQVTTGGSSSCGIKTAGKLLCWGLNNYGQLGGVKKWSATRPKAVSTEATWSEVAVSWAHACARRTDATLWCWGQNGRGAVGLGKTSRAVYTPHQVSPRYTFKEVAVGGFGSCAVRAEGSAWCWGENNLGQLGLGDAKARNAPRQVGRSADWSQLSKSFSHTCGVHDDGRLECWGLNDRGQLGDGTTTDRLSPVQAGAGRSWTAVATSESSTCALDTSGAVWCWGDNRYGQVGPAAADQVSSPVQRAELSRVTGLSAGWLHFCASNGTTTARCWGNGERGQLGASSPAARKPSGTVPPAATSEHDAKAHDRLHRLPAGVIADQELSPRPEVPGQQRAARSGVDLRVMTFNLLAEQFTAPGAHMSSWAPGRLRMEWADQLIRERRASLVGFQEMQPLQVGSFLNRTQGRWGLYPANTMGFGGATQSVAWDSSVWTPTYADTYRVPYMDATRPQPVVRLKNRATGRQVYLLNVHYSPGSQERDRDKATRITIKVIKKLQKDKLPILLTGDFNDRQEVYCKVTTKTRLRAALTNLRGKPCQAPKVMRVDHIFGSRGRFSDHRIDQDVKVRRTTDHAVQVATFTAP